MIALASVLLGFFAPGFHFPQMAAQITASSEQKAAKKASKKASKKKGGEITPATGDESQDPETPEPRTEKQAQLTV